MRWLKLMLCQLFEEYHRKKECDHTGQEIGREHGDTAGGIVHPDDMHQNQQDRDPQTKKLDQRKYHGHLGFSRTVEHSICHA